MGVGKECLLWGVWMGANMGKLFSFGNYLSNSLLWKQGKNIQKIVSKLFGFYFGKSVYLHPLNERSTTVSDRFFTENKVFEESIWRFQKSFLSLQSVSSFRNWMSAAKRLRKNDEKKLEVWKSLLTFAPAKLLRVSDLETKVLYRRNKVLWSIEAAKVYPSLLRQWSKQYLWV